jgi:hypothetical protein
MTSTTPLLRAALVGTALVALLAGCSSNDDAEPTPTPTTTATAEADAGQPDNECVGGIAYLQFTETVTELSLPEGCNTVIVLGDNGTATVGPVSDLGLMGNGNDITVEGVKRIDFTGNDNTVTHGGDAPEILGDETNSGTGNTLTAG